METGYVEDNENLSQLLNMKTKMNMSNVENGSVMEQVWESIRRKNMRSLGKKALREK